MAARLKLSQGTVSGSRTTLIQKNYLHPHPTGFYPNDQRNPSLFDQAHLGATAPNSPLESTNGGGSQIPPPDGSSPSVRYREEVFFREFPDLAAEFREHFARREALKKEVAQHSAAMAEITRLSLQHREKADKLARLNGSNGTDSHSKKGPFAGREAPSAPAPEALAAAGPYFDSPQEDISTPIEKVFAPQREIRGVKSENAPNSPAISTEADRPLKASTTEERTTAAAQAPAPPRAAAAESDPVLIALRQYGKTNQDGADRLTAECRRKFPNAPSEQIARFIHPRQGP
jgi:hypothetical protein